MAVERNAIVGISWNGKLIGTGFFLGSEGHVVTCHHVINGLSPISLRLTAGILVEATMDEELSIPECDVAVLTTTQKGHKYFDPCLEFEDGDMVTSAGYQYFSLNIPDLFPIGSGKIVGTTSVTFVRGNTYKLEGVLRINNEDIQEGISGAPLLLANKDKAAIGIINAKLNTGNGGFCLPFTAACRHSKRFETFIQSQIIHKKTKGQQLQYLETKALFNKHNDFEMGVLLDQKRYLPDKFCQRRDFKTQVNEFIHSPKLFFPVIGLAGTGKTTSLAELSIGINKQSDQIPFFIPAYRLRFDNHGFAFEILRHLQANVNEELNISDINRIFNDQGRMLVFIIDGLNEASVNDYNTFRNWFEGMYSFAKIRKFKVIFSTRDDFWPQVKSILPINLFFLFENDQPFFLKNFDNIEFQEAIEKYNVKTQNLGLADLQHPLLLRLYSLACQQNNQNAEFTSYNLFNEFVKVKCQEVALKNRKTLVAIKTHLIDKSRILLNENDYQVSASKFYSHGNDEINQALIVANVFVETGEDRVRIIFDQLAEFLVGNLIMSEVSGNVDWVEIFNNWSSIKVNALKFAFAAMEDKGESISTFLQNLTAVIGSLKYRGRVMLHFLNIITTLPSPRKYIKEIIGFFKAFQEIGHDSSVIHFINRFLPSLRLTTSEQVELILAAMVGTEEYPWKMRFWEREPPDGFLKWSLGNNHPLLSILTDANQKDRLAILSAISKSLSELSKPRYENLQDDFVNMNTIACALLFHLRDWDLEKVVDSLVYGYETYDSSYNECRPTIQKITESDPLTMFNFAKKWAVCQTHDNAVFAILEQLSFQETLDEDNALIIFKILNRQVVPSDLIPDCLQLLLKTSSYQSIVVERILDFCEKGINYGLTSLSPYLDSYFDLINSRLTNIIKDQPCSPLKPDFAMLLLTNKLSDKNQFKLLDDFEQFFKGAQPEQSLMYPYSIGLETQLNGIDVDHVYYDKLQAILKVALKNPRIKKSSFYYYLTTFYNTSKLKMEDKLSLIEDVLLNDQADEAEDLLYILIPKMPQILTERIAAIIKTVLLKRGDCIMKIILAAVILVKEHQYKLLIMLMQDVELSHLPTLQKLKRMIDADILVKDAVEHLLFPEWDV